MAILTRKNMDKRPKIPEIAKKSGNKIDTKVSMSPKTQKIQKTQKTQSTQNSPSRKLYTRKCVRFLPVADKIKTLKNTKNTLLIVQDMSTKEKKEFLTHHGLLKRRSKAPMHLIHTIVTTISTSSAPISKNTLKNIKNKKNK